MAAELYAERCLTDDELPSKDRAPFEETALRFAHAFLQGRIAQAYGELSLEAKLAIPQEQLAKTLSAIEQTKNLANIGPLQVTHTYYIRGAGAPNTALCTIVAHGSIASPEGQVAITAKAVPAQAHVVVEGDTKNNTWAFVLWLMPEQSTWRVLGFHIVPVATLHRTAFDFLAAARNETKAGHTFNAAILYATADSLADRGPDFRLGLQSVVQKEAKELARPKELQGQPPFQWDLGGHPYRIDRVGPLGVGDTLALVIRQEVPSVEDTKRAESLNRTLIEDYAKSFPEYRTAFDAIVIEAVDPTGKGFRTVQRNK